MTDLVPTTTPVNDAPPDRKQEAADVKRWFAKYEQARKFDEPARQQYARDRRYARGDSAFDISANLVGSYIDILEAFYYAKDPDLDIAPAPAAQTPSMDALRESAEMTVSADPMVMQQVQQQEQMVQAAEMLLPGSGAMMQQDVLGMAIEAEVMKLQDTYARKSRDTKAFADTLEVICTRLWSDAALKRRGRPWVRSGLSVGVGILKGSWQERTAPSPETQTAINDLQRDIARIKAIERDLVEDYGDEDANLAQLERELTRLQGQAEPVISRGFAVDNVSPENYVCAPGVSLSNYLDAPWNAERIPMRADDAMADFGLTRDQIKKCTIYKARKVEMSRNETPAMDGAINHDDADSFVTSSMSGASMEGESDDYVMCVEIWDREGGHVLTGIEGYPYWVKPAWVPTATSRFYPFFLLPMSDVDGQRHPQSLIARTWRLFDEYNRIMSRLREHRLRVVPQMMFDKEQVDPDTAKRLTSGVSVEWIGVSLTSANKTLNDVVKDKPYPAFDPGMYDVGPLMEQIERIWSIQEALSGAVSKTKTATEANIQQSGFEGRTNGRRDAMEDVLGELALYTAEVARKHISNEDALEIAGPAAFWPPHTGPDELRQLVNVDIRAGSSGKPNTNAERDAWGQTMPLLVEMVEKVGMLRNSTPEDMADSYEEIARITCQRSGDRLDVDQLLPKAGPAPQPPMPGEVPMNPQDPASQGGIPV